MSKVKLCGLRRKEDIELVNNYLPDYVGFVFAPSKRQISLNEALVLKGLLNPFIQVVGVFVNETLEQVLAYEKAKVIDCIQLHGDEDISYIKQLKEVSKLPLIQAIRVQDERDIKRANESLAHYVLLDKYSHKAYGGLGETFDWRLLSKVKRPYILAGGIGVDNVKQALSYEPYCIDLSSKVETDGVKDREKVKLFFEKWKEKKHE